MDGPEVIVRRVTSGRTNLLGRHGIWRKKHVQRGWFRPAVETWEAHPCEVVGFDDGRLYIRLEDTGKIEVWYSFSDIYGEELVLGDG